MPLANLLNGSISSGDVTLSAEDRPPPHPIHKHPHPHFHQPQLVDYQAEYEEDDSEYNEDEEFEEEEMEEHHFSTSFKFLLAGGIAGAGKLHISHITSCIV